MSRRWIFGVAGIVALCAALLFWPLDLSTARLSPVLLASDNSLLRAYPALDGQMRLPLSLHAVDPLFIDMLVGYEDRYFFRHPGVNPASLLRAALQWSKSGKIISGGSTLTMQTARLLHPASRNVWTKLREIWRALRLETQYSKQQILELYLRLAPYGGNIAGLRAASLIYFDKEPTRLTPDEAALLVVLPQNPNGFRPDRFPLAAQLARGKVLRRARDFGIISDTGFEAGRAAPVPALRHVLPFHAMHLADDLRLSKRRSPWRSTLDAPLQIQAEDILARRLENLPPHVTMAALIVENRTHKIRAYLGNADYFSAARAGQVDMVRAVRSPGSTLKPFLYGMAFQDGLAQPETMIADRPVHFGNYRPANFNQDFQGEMSIREALQQSLNVPAVKVLAQIGPERFLAKLRSAGTKFRLSKGETAADLPVILGGVGTSLWDLVQLYTSLANDGVPAQPVFLADQKTVAGTRLLTRRAARQVTQILTGSALNEGMMRGPDLSELAVKTGTSYGYRDAWAMGYTPGYTIGVWVGRADGSPSPGQVGRHTAIPVLLHLRSLLRDDNGHWAAQEAETVNADLPVNLRYWTGDRNEAVSSNHHDEALAISFPLEASVFNLQEMDAHGITFKAKGGVKPYQWYVNGNPQISDEQTNWQPREAGIYKITLQDKEGHTETSTIRLSDAPQLK